MVSRIVNKVCYIHTDGMYHVIQVAGQLYSPGYDMIAGILNLYEVIYVCMNNVIPSHTLS